MKTSLKIVVVLMAAVSATACAPNVNKYKANAYNTNQLNQKQELTVINILSITPAQVVVDNSENVNNAKMAVGFLGALAGGLAAANNSNSQYAGATGAVGGAALGAGAVGMIADNEVMVDGVTVSYQQGDKLFTSSQVGELCEFKQGTAMLIGSGNETRVQPNAVCPVKD